MAEAEYPSDDELFGTSRPLRGRIRHQTMMPMSFSEYASFKGRPHAPALGKVGEGMRRPCVVI